MADDFYPFVDSGDPAPDNRHITGTPDPSAADGAVGQGSDGNGTVFATRIAIYDDMLSTPRVIVVQPNDPRSYLEEITNTVYRSMKELGGSISLMVIRELVENFIHANFTEPIVSILDGGNTVRFADQGPGIDDKERAFEFGVTSANRSMKRYIRGTGAGLPMVQQYLENAGGAVSIEDNLGSGTVVTVSVDAARVQEIEANSARGAAVRGTSFTSQASNPTAPVPGAASPGGAGYQPGIPAYGMAAPYPQQPGQAYPYPYMGEYPYPQQGAAGSFAQNPGGYGMPGYPPAQPLQPGYGQSFPQQNHEFSTYPQYQPQPAHITSPAAGMPVRREQPYIDERDMNALGYLGIHGSGGPGELSQAFGQSVPTWSRVLAKLGEQGFVVKHGRKYTLTSLGESWLKDNA